MNRQWLFVRRMRGPAFLVLFGITALLNQFDILSFGQSWPLYLILAGVLALAERACFREVEPPYAGFDQQNPYPAYGQPVSGEPGTAILHAQPASQVEALGRREGER
jgi:hypothetical protein